MPRLTRKMSEKIISEDSPIDESSDDGDYRTSHARMLWHKKRIEEEIRIVVKASKKRVSEVMSMESKLFDSYLFSSGYQSKQPPWKRH